ncbi:MULTISPECIES: DNA repair protein RecN [Anaerostipes]|uniref:DNA repair protein RecN n=1 Tax=Anaerostipes TaxID=207244 RepID=UPI000952BA72|nr:MULTISPECIES: DNA repair protein RecN [unclassified Anaerostipes]MCI5623256.1 DNA repair protein RecN [Anaerostipes sp.]MDY2726567.1 DNA repair protein RecN [Anaerostipes faecalis]OLR58598.1 DNA repair protein RecN [Anaerostipes sp. 494a]
MLQYLHVKNLALIDEVEISFNEHLNILTGETGAGKSILIGSIESALGKKVSKDMIRPGSKEAVIELLFWTDDQKIIHEIESFDLTVEEGQIFIKRVINEKRSINKINDSTVTLNTLREVSHRLFDLHGQQEHQTLLKEKNHLAMLDHFLGTKEKQALDNCKKFYKKISDISREIDELAMDDQQRLREIGFLEHEIHEIQGVNLVKGEDEELEQIYRKMVHSREIAASCDVAARLTGYEEDISIGNQLTESIRKLQEVSHLDKEVMGYYEQLLQIEDLLSGFHQEITGYMDQMEFDEQTYFETEERLNIINGLKDKYGSTIDAVLQYENNAMERLEVLQDAENRIEELKRKRHKAEEAYNAEALRLSLARKTIAKKLQKDITDALEDLNFLSVVFEIQVTEEAQITPEGINKICFMISTNPGLPLRPVQEVASGGELSRIMLAMKSVLAQVDNVGTLIFDEIDTGISGETANRVAKKMAVISRNHQVIAITHLPQIAAMADSHYFIEKHSDQNKTTTVIRELKEQESLEEISRMISGNERTATSLNNAQEMKSLANDAKLY